LTRCLLLVIGLLLAAGPAHAPILPDIVNAKPPTGGGVTITGVSLSGNTFTPGTAGTVGTASATVSGGSFTGTWSLQTSGTDHSGTTCVNYGTNFTIASATGVLSNSTSAASGANPGVCVVATQAGATGSPFAQAETITGSAAGSIAYVRDNLNYSVSTAQTTITVTLSTTNAGDLFVVIIGGDSGTGANQPTATTVTASNGTTCTHATGAGPTGITNGQWIDMWNCPNNATAVAVTFTATFTNTTSNQVNYPQLTVGEFSGAKTSGADMGLGANATHSSATSMSVGPTTGSVALNDLVVSGTVPSNNQNSLGANQIAFTSNPDMSYQIVAAAGAITHTYGFASSTNAALSIGAFAHP
jgi:hypothetical protein